MAVNDNAQAARQAAEERRKFLYGFNPTMVKIWRERLALLGVIRTGSLYRSVWALGMSANADATEATFRQTFNMYGLYVDYGTGSNTWRGNPGDFGRENRRRRRKWFSQKYYASVMRLQEFMADNLGRHACLVVAQALDRKAARGVGSDNNVF